MGELLKYGASGMVYLLEQLFSDIWCDELVPRQWWVRLIVKKGDKESPAYFRGITLLSVVGKVFCKILNNRVVECLDKGEILNEGQAWFRVNRRMSRSAVLLEGEKSATFSSAVGANITLCVHS